jgi:hypothetical protein
MIRKLAMVAAATALAGSAIVAVQGVSGAKALPVDATHYSVTCTGITGSIKFNPPLTLSSSGTVTTAVKANLSGCTVTPSSGGTPVAVTGAKVKGTLTDTSSTGCAGLSGSSHNVGTLTTSWKSSPKLVATTSTLAVNSVTGGMTDGLNADSRATFAIPGLVPNGPATGPFQGSDNGAGDTTSASTQETIGSIIAVCSPTTSGTKTKPAKGLKKLTLVNPVSGAAVTLR